MILMRNQPSEGEYQEKETNLSGCPWHDAKAMLRKVGLRPTSQRMALGWLLFGKGHRHLTPEMLYEEAKTAKLSVSLATIYNTLKHFADVGLLRHIAANGARSYFDTNVTDHHHFYFVDGDELVDIPETELAISKLPPAPAGYDVVRIDVTVQLRRRNK